MPFPHTRMFPLESPVMASPFSAKVTHNTNLGFSCFCKKQQKTKCFFLFARFALIVSTVQSNRWDHLPTQAAMFEFVPHIRLYFFNFSFRGATGDLPVGQTFKFSVYCIISCHILLYCIVEYPTVLFCMYHIILYHFLSYHIKQFCIVLYRIASYCIISWSCLFDLHGLSENFLT